MTRYGPCHGCENLRLRPISSLGNLTNIQSPILYSRVRALLSYLSFDLAWDSCYHSAANSQAEKKCKISSSRYDSTVLIFKSWRARSAATNGDRQSTTNSNYYRFSPVLSWGCFDKPRVPLRGTCRTEDQIDQHAYVTLS